MKSLMSLMECMLQDCSVHTGADTTRDILSIRERVKSEGLSFLTITLPALAQALERGLESGCLSADHLRAFSKIRSGSPIPKLFSGMTRQVFDRDGALLPEPSPAAISCIRQICHMWKKVSIECSAERKKTAEEKFLQLEKELQGAYHRIPSHLRFSFRKFCRVLWGTTLGDLELRDPSLIVPRHGPGAVAIPMLQNQKYRMPTWTRRLEESGLHYDTHAFSSVNAMEAGPLPVVFDPGTEPPVRVVFVPKTQKTPRVIAIEPVHMQYMQQGLLFDIVSRLESHPITSGRINFARQDINARLALTSSKDGLLATLDLSDASDRVLCPLVRDMLDALPQLRKHVFACRSSRAQLPSGKTIHLRKFASMGSALCFPIEAMMFFSIIVFGRWQRSKAPLTRSLLNKICRDVYVYGDDIIVPTHEAPDTISDLTAFMLKVNADKSFYNGKFRESCGSDAYDGINVTPVYVRRLPPYSIRSSSEYVSWVALGNLLYEKGYYKAAEYTLAHLREHRIPYTLGTTTSGYVAVVRDSLPKQRRYNKYLHRSEVKALCVDVPLTDDHIDCWPALHKWFLLGMPRNSTAYSKTVGSGSLRLKNRWMPVH